MPTESEQRPAVGSEELSALVDGELSRPSVTAACGRWREDPDTRSAWYAYQLIGDVLRSEDLASDAARDRRFLERLRVRLADEPVVLAPEPLESAADSRARPARWSWRATTAVAAGFVAVGGVLVVLRGLQPVPVGAQDVAKVSPSVTVPRNEPAPVQAVVPMALSGDMVRDAGLDRYLAAHKRFAGSTALGVPSSFLRSATTAEAAGR